MTQADRVLSTPPTNMPKIPPVDPTRRRLLTVAAGGAVAAAIPTAVLTAAPAPDPIYAAIERHKAAAGISDAAVTARSRFPDTDMNDEREKQCSVLDDAVDDARSTLEQTGVDLIGAVPTTVGGIASAIAYIQRQMRDDGTFMPFDIELQFDVGYAGGGAGLLGWIDAFLNTIAVAVSELDRPDKAVQA